MYIVRDVFLQMKYSTIFNFCAWRGEPPGEPRLGRSLALPSIPRYGSGVKVPHSKKGAGQNSFAGRGLSPRGPDASARRPYLGAEEFCPAPLQESVPGICLIIVSQFYTVSGCKSVDSAVVTRFYDNRCRRDGKDERKQEQSEHFREGKMMKTVFKKCRPLILACVLGIFLALAGVRSHSAPPSAAAAGNSEPVVVGTAGMA